MTVETSQQVLESGVLVYAIRGRLSLGNTLMSIENALQELAARNAQRMIIDVTGLDQIDSAGLGTLIVVAGRAEQTGGKMAVAGARGSVARSFEIAHLDRIIPVYADLGSAIAGISAS